MSEYFGHTSKKKYTHEENLRFFKQTRDYRIETAITDEELGVRHPATFLLDSSLITAYNFKTYSHKVIQCGNYLQVYEMPETKQKNISHDLKYKSREKKIKDISSDYVQMEQDDFLKFKVKIDEEGIFFKNLNNEEIDKKIKEQRLKKKENKKIDIKNINRSQNQFKRLVKSNEDIFKTFITLTFDLNITSIAKANEKFRSWRTNIQKIKKDFAYVCVPEFQKRGAVHYHLLTNLDIKQNPDIIIPQKKFSEKQYEKMTEEQRKKCYDVIYWPHGYSSIFSVKNINMVGYMSKYMTKDIDNRLFGHRRYLASQNLKKPVVSYLDLQTADIVDFLTYNDKIRDYDLKFESIYADKLGQAIKFKEFKKKEVDNNV